MRDPKKQVFGQKSIYSKETTVFWEYGGVPVGQKLGMILENKVVKKLKLEKWSPKYEQES